MNGDESLDFIQSVVPLSEKRVENFVIKRTFLQVQEKFVTLQT